MSRHYLFEHNICPMQNKNARNTIRLNDNISFSFVVNFLKFHIDRDQNILIQILMFPEFWNNFFLWNGPLFLILESNSFFVLFLFCFVSLTIYDSTLSIHQRNACPPNPLFFNFYNSYFRLLSKRRFFFRLNSVVLNYRIKYFILLDLCIKCIIR